MAMKRLYIGGLGHTVSEKDLRDRFGKFGDVSDVEIITRKDENGAPLKTFGYININITETDYKRCVGILNKSTWKGGTLLIQLAKESFLHRLAEERQELVEKAKTPKPIPQEKLVDSLKAAGVENFHMKAAVPGTEIPGHTNWVVSKFGRVLPVVNLCKGRNKVFKYDPSKHCHNIRRLESADDITSVSKLTWEIEGGDDEISKKRRGEFPEQKTCPKRPKIDVALFLSNLPQRNGLNAAAAGNKSKAGIQENGLKMGKQKSVRVFDNDSDSEDDIRMLVAQEHLRSLKQTSMEDDDGNLEVVGDDFVVKSNVVWGGVEQDDVKTTNLLTSSKDDEDYDSADTDEILTRKKTQKVESTPASQNVLAESSQNKSSSESDDDDGDVSVDSDYEAMMGNCYRLDISLADLEQLAKKAEVVSDDESVEDLNDEPKTPSALPKQTGNNPEDILASLLGDDTPEKEGKKKKKNQVNTVSLPAFIGTKDLFGGAEPSLKRVAQNIDSESPKRLKQGLKVKERSISEDTSQPQSSNQALTALNIQTASKKLHKKASSEDDSSSEESESNGNEEVFTSKTSSASRLVRAIPETKLKTVSSNKSNTPIKPKHGKTSRSSSSDSSSQESESSEEEDNAKVSISKSPSASQSEQSSPETELKTSNSVKPSQTKTSRSSSSGSSSEESESSEEEDNEDSAKVLTSKTPPVAESVKSISKTEMKTCSSSNSPVKPSQTKTSRSSSSGSSSEEEDNKDGVMTSDTPLVAQTVKNISKTKMKTANSSKSPAKPSQTKTSRSSSSGSSSEEEESSEEEDNEDGAKVQTSKTPPVAESVKSISKTEMKTSNGSKSPIKPSQKKTSRSSSSDSSSEEEDNDKVSMSKRSLASQSAKALPEIKLKTCKSSNSINPMQKKTSSSDSSSEESESSEEEDDAKVLTSKRSSATQLARTTTETELKTVSSDNSVKPSQTKTFRSSSSDSSSEESETSDDETSRAKPATLKNIQENVVSHQTALHSAVIDAKKQQQDNQKRLAALEQRHKESEQQRKLIQGALSNTDTAKANKSKHIVFDSEDEEEDEATSKPEQPPTNLKKSLFEEDSGSDEDQQTSVLKEKKNDKPGGSKLFDSENEGDASEDDRFQIKPQFEGKAGQKLMKLQARFGADSRFQIDSRFMESDDESEDKDEAAPEKDADKQLLEEKKKSLDILQSVLNTNIQPQNTRKGKMFKDISSLHYDPTQDEHAAFEAKKEKPKKESKAERRLKRIEAEKLPEVSKDIYFDISVDLKEVFGTAKENQEEKETVSWDKETDDTEDIVKLMEVSNAEEKEDASAGFKFSFFGEDTAPETTSKTDEYKIEKLKEAKFSWQVDPRFQDSSSDEEEVDEVEEEQPASSTITEEPTKSKKAFFFFYQNDERLKEGPGMFCRSVNLQDQRQDWELKRTSLREECHRKHKNAKRRQRPSLKT